MATAWKIPNLAICDLFAAKRNTTLEYEWGRLICIVLAPDRIQIYVHK